MKEFIKRNKALKGLILETAEIAGYLWQRGWAERNAGNISVNITDLMLPEFPVVDSSACILLSTKFPKLAGNYFLITGTGKRMRDLARKPMKDALIIRLNEDASGYSFISNNADSENLRPTSELPAHLGIHQMITERGSTEKVVMHTHVTELIALTQCKEFCNQEVLNKIVWDMHPETIMFVPKGIGFVPYLLPGSLDIAKETIIALQDQDVALWEKHGIFAIGKNVADTFDLIDILAKSARIYFLCRSADIIPDGFTEEQLEALKKLYANF